MKATFRIFESTLRKHKAFENACAFATTLGPGRLINMSHSHEAFVRIVTVWYWSEDVVDSAETHNW